MMYNSNIKRVYYIYISYYIQRYIFLCARLYYRRGVGKQNNILIGRVLGKQFIG